VTNQELRELDDWIAINVMGLKFNGHHWVLKSDENLCAKLGGHCPEYTTDPAAAMAVLEKCAATNAAGKTITIVIFSELEHGRFGVGCEAAYEKDEIDPQFATTLPLAICLFARKLFEK